MGNPMQGEASASIEANGNDEPQSPVFSADQLRELNKVMTSYRKTFQKDIAAGVQSALSGLVQPKTEEEQPDRSPATIKQVNSETAELKKQIALLLEKDQKRETELRNERSDKALTDALLSNGIASSRLPHAKAWLRDRVRYDDDGALRFSHDHIDYDLPDGLARWAKTPDAELYRASTGAQGSGVKSIKPPVQSPQSGNPEADARAAFAAKYGTNLPAPKQSI